MSGFSKCGIWPLKPEIFDDCFTSAHQSSVVHDSDPEVSPNAQPVDSSDAKPEASPDSVPATCASTDINEPATETELDKTITVLPQDIIPVPKIVYKNPNQGTKKKNKAKGATVIVTSSPYLKQLTTEEENKKMKEDVKNYCREIKALKKALKGKAKDSPCESKKIKKEARRELFLGKDEPKKKKKKNMILNIENDEVPKVISSVSSLTLDSSNFTPGQFVLVSFNDYGVSDLTDDKPTSSKECKPVYYAGFITKLSSETEVETKFLRRSDLKKGNQIKFTYPEVDDLCKHPVSSIVLLLPKPKTTMGKSKRLGSLFQFEDSRMTDFNPIV